MNCRSVLEDAASMLNRCARTALLSGVLPVLLVAGDSAATGEPCKDTTTLIVVRHADRRGTEDALSPAGAARALELARVGEKAGVDAIYHSDTDRTRLTAMPLAEALGLAPAVHPARDTDGLVERIFAEHCGGTVLVVGHSNTVNRIIARAGGPELGDLPENEFDNLFILTVPPHDRTRARLVNLQYGAPSP